MWRYSLFIIGAVLMAGCGGGDGFDCPNAGLASTSLTTAMEEEGGADNTTADADTTSTNNFPSTPIPQSGGSLCPVDLSGGTGNGAAPNCVFNQFTQEQECN